MVRVGRWILFGILLVCAIYVTSLIGSMHQSFNTKPWEKLPVDQQRIVVIIPDTNNIDVHSIRKETEIAGERYGAFLDFYETATAAEQIQVIQIAADSVVDGVLLYPMEKTGYESALEECRQKDIPVVVISQRLENAAFDTFIGSAINSERMAVLSCISAMGGKGKVLLVDRLNSGGELCMEAALLEPTEEATLCNIPQLKTKVADVTNAPFEGYQVERVVVMDEQQSSSYSLHTEIYKLLSTQRPDAVFSYDEDVTSVIAACLSNSNGLNEMYAVGYGDLRECQEQIRNGTLDGLVQQNDAYAAALAVRYLVELCKGGIMPENLDSGIVLISADNLERILAGDEM